MPVPSAIRAAFMIALALPLLTIGAGPKKASADPLVVDLSNHLVAITTGFTGTNVLLFGAVEEEGDPDVLVRGEGEGGAGEGHEDQQEDREFLGEGEGDVAQLDPPGEEPFVRQALAVDPDGQTLLYPVHKRRPAFSEATT